MTEEERILRDLTEEWGFVVAVVFATLVFGMFFGERPTFYFLLLILAGQILVNTDRIISALGRR